MGARKKLGNPILNRRSSFFAILMAFGSTAFALPKLGDAEWIRRFRVFIKALNDFVAALDDDKLDRAKWERVRATFHHLED